jgi:hypothetical protein
MAIVHCWYRCSIQHPDGPNLGDGFVWACFGAIGATTGRHCTRAPAATTLARPHPEPDEQRRPGHP